MNRYSALLIDEDENEEDEFTVVELSNGKMVVLWYSDLEV